MVTARGEPIDVYLCGCTDCQRGTGSAFSYAAIFPESAVSIVGETGSEATPDAPSTALSARLAGRLCCSAPKACQGSCPLAALLIRASLDPQSCSGPRDGITGSSFQQASP